MMVKINRTTISLVLILLIAILFNIASRRIIDNSYDEKTDEVLEIKVDTANENLEDNKRIVAVSLENKIDELSMQEDYVYGLDELEEILKVNTQDYSNTDEITDFAPNQIDYYKVIEYNISQLKEGNEDTINEYFGNIYEITSDIVVDRLLATEVSYIDTTVNEFGNEVVNIHVCTVDYQKMNSDYQTILTEALTNEYDNPEEYTKNKIAEDYLDGHYKVCYNVPVEIENNRIVITENLKTAITGGWYFGEDSSLQKVDCLIEE